MASTSELSPFSRLLPRRRVDSVEETRGYQSTRKRVSEATASVAGVAATVAHDVLSTGVDLLQLAPIPALGTAGTVLLSIWDAVQLIEINRVAYLRLTERCAEALLSVHEEIRLAGSEAINELGEPLRKLHSAFNEVHAFLLRQKRRTFLQRYLKRDEDQRDIGHCNTALDETISLFSLKIQIRTLKLVQESEARRQEDSKVLASLVAAPSSPETSAVDVTASATSMEIDQLKDPVKVRWLLAGYRRAQCVRDRNADFIDLRTLLSAALKERNDVAMIEVLQIGRDEMPEAIRTLQRVLQHDAETVRQHAHPTVASIGPVRVQSDVTPAPDSNGSRGESALDPFDRDFISTGIEALSRLTLSQGAEIAVPSWTITRHEVEIEKKIGIGFFSDVYKGQCRERTVAIKVLSSTTPRKLFVHEVNIWIQLQHPHVLKLLGASSTTSDPPWFLVSPYYSNGNLAHYLKGLDPDSSPDTVKMMHEVAEGMLYLHDKGIMHGDLKAANILVDDHFHCIVSDFGQSEIKSEVYRLSALPVSRGTLRWQSPELMLGIIVRLTPEIDMYAFGILCTEILSQGTLPWPLADDNTVRHLVCEQGRRPELPPSCMLGSPLSIIIESAWHPESRLRPSFRTVVRQLTTLRTARPTVQLSGPVSRDHDTPQYETGQYSYEASSSSSLRPLSVYAGHYGYTSLPYLLPTESRHHPHGYFDRHDTVTPVAAGRGRMIPASKYGHTTAGRDRHVNKIQLHDPVLFNTTNPGVVGIALSDALAGKYQQLAGRDDRLFQSCGPSISIRIDWAGCYPSWSRQIPTRDFKNPPGPVTRSKVAKNVARSVQRFIDEMNLKPLVEDADHSWAVGCARNGIVLEELALVRLEHIYKGSWQARLCFAHADLPPIAQPLSPSEFACYPSSYPSFPSLYSDQSQLPPSPHYSAYLSLM